MEDGGLVPRIIPLLGFQKFFLWRPGFWHSERNYFPGNLLIFRFLPSPNWIIPRNPILWSSGKASNFINFLSKSLFPFLLKLRTPFPKRGLGWKVWNGGLTFLSILSQQLYLFQNFLNSWAFPILALKGNSFPLKVLNF